LPILDIPAPGGAIPAYLAFPAGAFPAPGILLLHDAGSDWRECQAHADEFADSGFLALSVDPAHLSGMHRCLREFARDLINGQGQAFAILQACCTWLSSQPDCTGRVGISGFCVTAGYSMLLVLDRETDRETDREANGDAAGPANGSMGKLPEVVDSFLGSQCPLLSNGGNRSVLNEAVAQELEQSLEKALAFLTAQNQPDAELMFMNDLRVFWFKLLRLPGNGIRDAQGFHRNVTGFFSSHLASN